jgi:hypothetical protein
MEAFWILAILRTIISRETKASMKPRLHVTTRSTSTSKAISLVFTFVSPILESVTILLLQSRLARMERLRVEYELQNYKSNGKRLTALAMVDECFVTSN